MKYTILYDLGAKNKDFEKISAPMRKIIKKAIETKLTVDPIKFGKRLRYDLKGYRRLRVGDCRVIYKVIEEKVIVIIVDIDQRKDIYKD